MKIDALTTEKFHTTKWVCIFSTAFLLFAVLVVLVSGVSGVVMVLFLPLVVSQVSCVILVFNLARRIGNPPAAQNE